MFWLTFSLVKSPSPNGKNLVQFLEKSLSRKRTVKEIKEEQMKTEADLMFAVPPDLEKAKIHGKAQRARFFDPNLNVIN
jgi:hypothetical protein